MIDKTDKRLRADQFRQRLSDAIAHMRTEDGSWWTGYVFTDAVYWPDERPTWTAGAILLAADAMQQLTPACHLLCGDGAQATTIHPG